MKLQTSQRIAPVLAVLLTLTACSTSTLIGTLQIVTDAVTVAIPVLQAAGVDPAALALAQTYLSAVSTATSEAATELASGDSTAIKTSKILADFAGVIAPTIGNSEVAAVIRAVAAAVQSFLTLLGQGTVTLRTTPALAGQVVKPGFSDRRRLGSIKSQCQKNLHALGH